MAWGEVQRDEHGLIARAKEGDDEAFGELVRRYQHEVYTLALRLTGDRDLAADVSQEALVRAWRALPRFRGDARFSTWLHRIVVNVAHTHRQRVAKRRTDRLDDAGAEPIAAGLTPEAAGESTDLRPRLLEALGRLKPETRAVVVLKDVYDWTHHDIAEQLRIAVPTAKVRLHRGRKRLRQLLWDEGVR